MIQVMKGNRQLTIQKDQLQRYIDLGYNQIDEDGEVVRTGNPVTLAEWRAYARSLETQAEQMTECIKQLKGQLAEKADAEPEKPKTARGKAAVKEAPPPEGTERDG